MKVQVESVSSIEKRLSIEVDAQVVNRELTNAYATLAQQVKLPGFRPGKVPRRILEQKFRSEIEADVVRRVQAQATVDAIKSHDVKAVGEPHYSGGKLVPNATYAFTARLEVKPEVTIKEYKGLALQKLDSAIDDAKVNEQLERLRSSRSTLEPVSGRDVAKQGDMAVIDFDATKNGEAFPGNTGRNVTVEVAPGELVEGNLPQLDGMKLGEQRAFDYTFPAEYRVAEVKGQTAKFTVTLKELKERKLPELNDDFAKSQGADTMDALRTRVKTDLERGAKNRVETEAREGLLKALIEKNPFECPNSMIERGVDYMLDGALGSLMRSGVDPRMLNLDWNKLRADMRPRAEVEVRGSLLLEALGKAENLTVADADFDAKFEEISKETGTPLAQVKTRFATDEAKDSLKVRLVEEKAMALIRQHANWS
ncbi:MAG: trigger factor [Myxococcaceae bacterium]|nr:trigger factor [Myxococcaceae bacterium]